MSEPRKIVLLGATGSIGESTCTVLRQHPDQLQLVGAAAHSDAAGLEAIGKAFNVSHLSLFQKEGPEGLMRLATLPEADVIVIATTGTIGLFPMLAALEAGKTVALASKEILVLGGEQVMARVRSAPGTLLPVDSEHSALFQCLQARKEAPRRLILTASGGPFLRWTLEELKHVTVAAALRHPNWDMGRKITIDSATMANKGLEMIEARWLFDFAPEQIVVRIHPQSIIHSMVEFQDASIIAQLSPPSMTFPIQLALTWPSSLSAPSPGLDLDRIHTLELRPPDETKFPCLRLAREALLSGGNACAYYNTANAVAVDAFLENRIPFLAIPQLIENTLSKARLHETVGLEDLHELEASAKSLALEACGSLVD
jgi:1-deoxy-D-xylulose-5-phosphate reductoisomerase